jgi:hypothetical protein
LPTGRSVPLPTPVLHQGNLLAAVGDGGAAVRFTLWA